MKTVEPIRIQKGMKVSELITAFDAAGVMGAGKIADAVSIAKEMKKKKCTVFVGLAGAMVPAGMKEILIDMIEQGFIDVLVSTGANLTHDAVEALGYHHYQGSEYADDKELHKQGYDRMYDCYMPNTVYEKLEEFIKEHFDALKECKTSREILYTLGLRLPKNKRSLLRVCAERKIPIFCPGLADSGLGLMFWGQLAKGKTINAGLFDDLKEILSLAWDAKHAAVFYIGGGMPKNYIQQAMQFCPNKAEYGIQITMDRPEPGGSSGAELKEGISWGKMHDKARFVNVVCDATIALPLIWAGYRG